MLYFAYGSNMATPRLMHRVPSARAVGSARLPRHSLKFHKQGRDASARCDAAFTGDANDAVHGVVFEMGLSDKTLLDRLEGLGNGYQDKRVTVFSPDGWTVEACSCYATRIDPLLKPCEWYQVHVMRGAREHGLPAGYIHRIAAVATLPDPDRSRQVRELSIYC